MEALVEVSSLEEVERLRQDGAGTGAGVCPRCGAAVLAAAFYVAGRGYLVTRDCRQAVGEKPTCLYRQVL